MSCAILLSHYSDSKPTAPRFSIMRKLKWDSNPTSNRFRETFEQRTENKTKMAGGGGGGGEGVIDISSGLAFGSKLRQN